MAAIQSDVDFSDSDFLVSQMGRKARFSELKRKTEAPETAAPEQIGESTEESQASAWRLLVGKLLVLIPLVLLAWYLLANR